MHVCIYALGRKISNYKFRPYIVMMIIIIIIILILIIIIIIISNGNTTEWSTNQGVILLPGKFLLFDWLRAEVFQPNLKYLHVKITVSMVIPKSPNIVVARVTQKWRKDF